MSCIYLNGEGEQTISRYGHLWPNCFPDNCPPEAISEERNMAIYRLCYNRENPTAEDFLCDYANPYKGEKLRAKPISPLKYIKAFGISVFDDEEFAISMLQSFHMRKHHKSIAVGSGGNGYSCDEGGHHYIWWAYANNDPLSHFHQVYSTPEEEGEEDDGIL